MDKKYKRMLVTTALPYANGPVHIGHLAGVYVPADIYTRYLRLCGEDVILIGGSDEHGVPITIKAQKEGITPQDVVDRYHKIIKDSMEGLGISFDIYSRTTSEMHHKTASDFFKKLYDKGEFIEKTSKQLYDEKADQYLADRYVTGTCPKCESELRYLEEELRRRRQLGKAAVVTGLSLGLAATFASCNAEQGDKLAGEPEAENTVETVAAEPQSKSADSTKLESVVKCLNLNPEGIVLDLETDTPQTETTTELLDDMLYVGDIEPIDDPD